MPRRCCSLEQTALRSTMTTMVKIRTRVTRKCVRSSNFPAPAEFQWIGGGGLVRLPGRGREGIWGRGAVVGGWGGGRMDGRSQSWPTVLLIAGLCALWAGCGSHQPVVCASPANSSLCTCGGGCPIQAQPVLFATTTSDQILGFLIAPSGSLTAVAPVSGPANSQSITGMNGAIYFADSPNDQVAGESWSIDRKST